MPWNGDGEVYGLSVYRPRSEGGWVVGAMGNGALTLRRVDVDEAVTRCRARLCVASRS